MTQPDGNLGPPSDERRQGSIKVATCPRGHAYFAGIETRCPRCEPPAPVELFAPIDFAGPPPRVIDDRNPCFHSAENDARVADHYEKLLAAIKECAEPVVEKTRKLLSFAVWLAGRGDAAYVNLRLEITLAFVDLGDEAIRMLVKAQRYRPDLRPIAEDIIASRYRKARVRIACEACGRDLEEADAAKHICQKCLKPFDPTLLDGRIWGRCPACEKMIHESDRDAELRTCGCGRRYVQKDINLLITQGRKRMINDVLDGEKQLGETH